MKRIPTFILLLILASCIVACGKSGKDSIAENDNLAKILGSGAAGSGRGAGESAVADLPDVDSANMRSNSTEGVTYFKLVDTVETAIEPAGKYTVGMADNSTTITVKDADGNVTETVTIGAQGDGSKGAVKSAASIVVPEGGTVTSVGGTCIAQLND